MSGQGSPEHPGVGGMMMKCLVLTVQFTPAEPQTQTILTDIIILINIRQSVNLDLKTLSYLVIGSVPSNQKEASNMSAIIEL